MTQTSRTKKSDKGSSQQKLEATKKTPVSRNGVSGNDDSSKSSDKRKTPTAPKKAVAIAPKQPKVAKPSKTAPEKTSPAVKKPKKVEEAVKAAPKKSVAKTPEKAPAKKPVAKVEKALAEKVNVKAEKTVEKAKKAPAKKPVLEESVSQILPDESPVREDARAQPEFSAQTRRSSTEVTADAVEEVKPIAVIEDSSSADFPHEMSAAYRVLLGLRIEPKLATQVEKSGFTALTPAQLACLPTALDGANFFATDIDPSEKYLVYFLAAANRLLQNRLGRGKPRAPTVLVILPSQAACTEALGKAKSLLGPLGLKTWAVLEGHPLDEKSLRGLEAGADVLLVSPKSLRALLQKQALELSNLGLLVCDHLDDILAAEGGQETVEQVLQDPVLPQEHQRIFVAPKATDKARQFGAANIDNGQHIDAGSLAWCTAHAKRQSLHAVPSVEKFPILLGWLGERNPTCALVFANTRVVAEWLTYKLIKNGYKADLLTAAPLRTRQQQIFSRIQKGELNVIVATDRAAANLHIPHLADVYNFDVPETPENYLLRLSCLSREVKNPQAVTLLCEDYGYHMKGIVECIGFLPNTNPVPEKFAAIEDKSDMPFDARGRVRPIWDPEALARPEASASDGASASYRPRDEAAPSEGVSASYRPRDEAAAEPFTTLSRPAAAAAAAPAAAVVVSTVRTTSSAEKPQVERTTERTTTPAAITLERLEQPAERSERVAPEARKTGRPERQERTERPATERRTPERAERPAAAAPREEGMRRGKHAGEGAKQTRRDEKARETIEAALVAAREAARRKQESVGLPTGDVKKDFSNLVLIARDSFAAALDVVQERALGEIEKRFPTLSGYVKKAWQSQHEKKESKK